MLSKKILIIGLIVIIAIILITIFAIPKQVEITTVKVGSLPVIQGLPWYLAIEKGYFKEKGINVEFTKFEAPNLIIDALLQDQIDFSSTSGATGITGIAEFKNPGKLKIYAISGGYIENQNEALMISIDSNLGNIKELKGKKLGILAGTIQWRTIARELLSLNGLNFDKDLTIVELAPSIQIQALASKQVDAVLALEPIPTIMKEKGVGKELMSAPVEKLIANPIYPGAGAVRTEFAEKNPELTKKIINIIDKAIKEIEKNPDDARKYLVNYTPLDQTTINKAPISTFKMYYQINDVDKESLQKFWNLFTKYNVIDGKIDFDKIVLKE